jgi:SAM-dependent methyltransferase
MSLKDMIARQFRRPTGILGAFSSAFMATANRPAIEWAIDQCDIHATDTVLEIGFGPGIGLELCARLVPTGRILGLDFSPDMVAKAGRRNRAAIGRGAMELRCGDLNPAPFASGSVDKAFAVNVVYFWHQPQAEISEILRMLKPGVRMVLYLTDRRALAAKSFTHGNIFAKYTPQEIVAIARSCGFADARFVSRELIPGKTGYCIVADKR